MFGLFDSAMDILVRYGRQLAEMADHPRVNLTEVDHEYEHGRMTAEEREEAYRIAEIQVAGVKNLERKLVRALRFRPWGYRKFWETLDLQLAQAAQNAREGSFRKALISDLIREKKQMEEAGNPYYSPWFWQTWYTEVYLPGITPPPAPAP